MATIDLTAAPSPDELAIISEGLTSFNQMEVGPSDRQTLTVLIRDESGRAIGGLSGYTAWGWLFTQLLFIPASLQGQGWAGRILTQAEDEARRRGCHGAWIDTFNPNARKVYMRQGYEVFGELPSFVTDRTRTFLKKAL
ncbi:GNAT family N-acetyltransferase [Neorhizobium lilium]|uniref:GNAT family N-acetyltransferase n=1 Tax=Neorhizobium lilium TaxID=2503024 RepID=A0A444LIB7_9HYPH|nr:GNAT family N-acetyltransferase [Neorhizobium lilium]RWX78657.1 GNAT family N-acetyltransferase [Neorhizobium lilium]